MKHIERPASAFNKLGDIGQISSVGWADIPTYYYDFTRFELPLTAADFAVQFGAQRVVFNLEDDPPCDRQTNAAVGSSVNEVFLAMGAGVIAIGEGEAFAAHGMTIDRPTAEQGTPTANFASDACSDYFCGAIDLSTVTAAGAQQAVLWWGAPTWRFIEKFFQAYRLQILVNRRFEIVNESLFDVGMAPLPPEFKGASDSRIPTLPFIREVNDVMAAKSINSVFMGGNNGTNSDNVVYCLPPANVPVTYGHPRIVGLSNRIYTFGQPIMFMPFMQFEVSFINIEDAACYRALQNTTTLSCITQDAILTNAVTGVATVCGIQCIVPGGTVSLGVVMKGYALQPQACIDYLSQTIAGTASAEMYKDSEYLMGLAGSHALHGELAGFLEGA